MRIKPQYKDRYPGLTPFDKGQSTIFFGRDKEKKELYYQVCLEKMVVLFGKSGLGKSSLLNAGVSPMLEKNGYLPIRIRFTSGSQASATADSENLLLRDFKLVLRAETYRGNILYNKENPQLWEFVKAARFTEFISATANPELNAWIAAKTPAAEQTSSTTANTPVTPVFIFDQFEEFFHHPVRHQQEFLKQLAELVHDETPYRILDWITSMEPEDRTPEQVSWHQQPNLKVIFALRSDSLANLQSMVPFIPTVLRNRYELKPLTPEQAAQAISGPAEKTDLGPDYIPPFSYNDNTLNEIIAQLRGNTNEIESSQLQIVCNFIEDKVKQVLKERNDGSAIQVDSTIINPQQDFPLILDNFYETQLQKISEPADRGKARKLIEDDLVIDGVRDSISKNKLNKNYEIDDDLIEEILDTRLIREETTNWGPIYELSHDTLIAPVEKSKNKRLQAEEKQNQEEERIRLAELAKQKDEELKERYAQLAKEIQLREEAERQKAELERLTRKVRTRGLWVFILLLVISVGGAIFLNIRKQNAIYKQEKAEREQQKAELDKEVADFQRDSTIQELDKTKSTLLKVIVEADSLNKTNTNHDTVINGSPGFKKDTAINNILDSIFTNELNKNPNFRRLNTKQKIEALKKLYPADKSKMIRLQFKPDIKESMKMN